MIDPLDIILTALFAGVGTGIGIPIGGYLTERLKKYYANKKITIHSIIKNNERREQNGTKEERYYMGLVL